MYICPNFVKKKKRIPDPFSNPRGIEKDSESYEKVSPTAGVRREVPGGGHRVAGVLRGVPGGGCRVAGVLREVPGGSRGQPGRNVNRLREGGGVAGGRERYVARRRACNEKGFNEKRRKRERGKDTKDISGLLRKSGGCSQASSPINIFLFGPLHVRSGMIISFC